VREEVVKKLKKLLHRLPDHARFDEETEGWCCALDGTDCIPGESSCSATTCRTKAEWVIDLLERKDDFLAPPEQELQLLGEELDELLRAGGS